MFCKTKVWLINPVLDFLLFSGGLGWFLLSLHLFVPDQFTLHTQSVLLVLGSLVLTNTHFGAPLLVANKTGAAKFMVKPLLLSIFVVATIAALWAPPLLSLLVQAYLCCVVIHYTCQNIQIVRLYLQRGNFELSRSATLCLYTFALSLSTWSLTRQVIDDGSALVSFQGLSLPEWPFLHPVVGFALAVVCATSGLILMVQILSVAASTRRLFPVAAALTLISTSFMFCVTGTISAVLWLFVPAFVHAIQSIGLHLIETPQGSKLSVWSWLSKCFLLGLGITYCLPACCHYVGIGEQHAYLAIIVVFSFHHFVIELLTRSSKTKNLALEPALVLQNEQIPRVALCIEDLVPPGSGVPLTGA